MSSGPQYAALTELLAKFGRVVDTCGYVTLTSEQASVLRSLGFPDAAGAGRWKVPTLPVTPEALPAIRDHPRPEPPAEENPSDSEEASEAEEARKAEVVMVARKILKSVRKEGGRLAKRKMQQRLSRHTKGTFKEALGELIARGLVTLEGLMIVEVGRVMQNVMQNDPDARRASQKIAP